MRQGGFAPLHPNVEIQIERVHSTGVEGGTPCAINTKIDFLAGERCFRLTPKQMMRRRLHERGESPALCKKFDIHIDCTQVALLEGPELEIPSDSNGTHASSEGPRRVSFPSSSDLPSLMQSA